jgi:hypothetical protein
MYMYTCIHCMYSYAAHKKKTREKETGDDDDHWRGIEELAGWCVRRGDELESSMHPPLLIANTS